VSPTASTRTSSVRKSGGPVKTADQFARTCSRPRNARAARAARSRHPWAKHPTNASMSWAFIAAYGRVTRCSAIVLWPLRRIASSGSADARLAWIRAPSASLPPSADAGARRADVARRWTLAARRRGERDNSAWCNGAPIAVVDQPSAARTRSPSAASLSTGSLE
jgi:hypothetical protein